MAAACVSIQQRFRAKRAVSAILQHAICLVCTLLGAYKFMQNHVPTLHNSLSAQVGCKCICAMIDQCFAVAGVGKAAGRELQGEHEEQRGLLWGSEPDVQQP